MGSLFSRSSAPPSEPGARDRAAVEVAALPGIDDVVEGAQPTPLARLPFLAIGFVRGMGDKI